MHPELRLFEDFMTDRGVLTVPAAPRMFFVLRGSVTVEDRSVERGEVWYGANAIAARAGEAGAILWRFELSNGTFAPAAKSSGLATREKLCAPLASLPQGDLLWRGDSVTFPPGGVAYLHRHQGPGIRCLIDGELRVDTNGHSNTYQTGGAWFESGPEPVFAQAGDRPTRFVRVMILPRMLAGKSSIQYVNDDDRAKPKSQQYEVFVDEPLQL